MDQELRALRGTEHSHRSEVGRVEKKQTGGFVGFMSLKDTSAGDGYIGAALVTDLRGVPQEFRCTHPVKPTVVQKSLYGTALEPYIGVELCGKPLFALLQNKPSILIVESEILLELRSAVSCPVVLVRKAGEAIEVSASGGKRSPLIRIESTSGKYQPLVITTHPAYADDFSSTRAIVEEAFASFDLMEPFGRISKALEMLAKQDQRFQ